MKLNLRSACSMGLLGWVLFIGCGADSPPTPPAVPTTDSAAGDGGAGAAGGGTRGNSGGHAGASASSGNGGGTQGRDAGHGGSGAKPGEAGISGSSGAAGSSARDAAADRGGRGGLDAGQRDAASASHVVINELVADPQRDWNDTAGGSTPFDGTPGTGAVSGADEWIELYNGSGAALDLSGWSLIMTDGTPAAELLGAGDAVLAFSAGGTLTRFQPEEYLIVGNPKGDLNNTITVELYDAAGVLIDRVALGSEGGGPSANATSSEDEAIARVPNAVDTDDDAADLLARPPTPGAAN